MMWEVKMIELTEQQSLAIGPGPSDVFRVRDPRTNETFVLLKTEEYERLAAADYDDSPWTEEERHAAAYEVMSDPNDDYWDNR
jgi:hypothetical protein